MNCIDIQNDITIIENGTFDSTIQLATGSPAVPVDLTGYTGKMAVKGLITDTTPLIYLATATSAFAIDGPTGIYLDDASSGKIRRYIRDNDTTGLCSKHKNIIGCYDLFLTSPALETVYRIYGAANIIAAITTI